MTSNLSKIIELHNKPELIRNVCIIGHVDHGKTTIADSLIASNGIISQRMAGQMRYLDNREDEQLKGITMKTSAIALCHQEHLVNLIDSPGHVDFSSEVSTAVRLCDGAIIIVDVIEGVSAQTHAVLRQSWVAHIRPVLVLNKVDRLILERRMTPSESYIHLHHIIQQVNLITNELFTADMMMRTALESEEPSLPENTLPAEDKVYDWAIDIDEAHESSIYFSPDRGNVIFASALDGWAFSIKQFVEVLSSKLKMRSDVLQKSLWGDFYLNSKTKRSMKGAQVNGKKCLFVQLVLDNIWSVYDSIYINRDKEKGDKIVRSLNLSISPRDVKHSDSRVYLKAIMSQWLPLHKAVLDMVIEKLPSPYMSLDRAEKLLTNRLAQLHALPTATQSLKHALHECNSADSAPVIAFVSKMFPVSASILPERRQRPLTKEELKERHERAKKRFFEKHSQTGHPDHFMVPEEGTCSKELNGTPIEKPSVVDQSQTVFLAFARVFSGTLHKGQQLYVLRPKHDPAYYAEHHLTLSCRSISDVELTNHVSVGTIEQLLICMGREVESVESIPAGNVIAIRGLQEHIVKSATLSDTLACPPFTPLFHDASAIVSVAIEPVNAYDIKHLEQGLRLLNQADPCVKVLVRDTGEHVIVTAGEVHLDRCIHDLEGQYAKVKLNVSLPIVPFRETIVEPPKVDRVNQIIDSFNIQLNTSVDTNSQEISHFIDVYTSDKKHSLRIVAIPLPQKITSFIESNKLLIKQIFKNRQFDSNRKRHTHLSEKLVDDFTEFKQGLTEVFNQSGDVRTSNIDKVLSFGPYHHGPNILLNNAANCDINVWNIFNHETYDAKLLGIVNGFQLATQAGPICNEPMSGVCFIIDQWKWTTTGKLSEHAENLQFDLESKLQAKGSSSNHELPLDLHGDTSDFKSSSSKCADTDISLNFHNITRLNLGSDTPMTTTSETNCDDESVNIQSTGLQCDSLPIVSSVKLSSETPNVESCSIDKTDCDTSSNSTIIRQELNLEVESPKDIHGHNTSGQLMSCVKAGCLRAFQAQPQRLMTAMYECQIQATSDVLGRLYAVLGKRHGRVLSEDLQEGTQTFMVVATLPVVESFGFADEIRTKTSGLASPQLKFSHWQIVDVDPYWVPSTEEEYLHFGEKADTENRARVYMNAIRRRKGLAVDEKIVQHAEKQRTLKKNK